MSYENCLKSYPKNCLMSYPRNNPSWTVRDYHILRNELKAKGILDHIRVGNVHTLFCSLCSLDIGKKMIIHFKTNHSEILEETIKELVMKGLLDPKFLSMHFNMNHDIGLPIRIA